MNSKHRRTLAAVFRKPVSASIEWTREAKRYQMTDAWDFLERIGVKP